MEEESQKGYGRKRRKKRSRLGWGKVKKREGKLWAWRRYVWSRIKLRVQGECRGKVSLLSPINQALRPEREPLTVGDPLVDWATGRCHAQPTGANMEKLPLFTQSWRSCLCRSVYNVYRRHTSSCQNIVVRWLLKGQALAGCSFQFILFIYLLKILFTMAHGSFHH